MFFEDSRLVDSSQQLVTLTGRLPKVSLKDLPSYDRFMQEIEENILDDLYRDIDRINEKI